MVRVVVAGSLFALLLAGPAADATAQTLGTFKWQLEPFCNVVTVTITQQGAVYALTGTDDQCGAARTAATTGTAFLNPDGTVGFGFSVVPSPNGVAVTVDASINPASLSGSWRDSSGNSGTFRFAPGGTSGGSPRPAGPALSGVALGLGLRYLPAATGGPVLEIDGGEVGQLLRVSTPSVGSIAFGQGALQAVRFDGQGNTALGDSTLSTLTTGDLNTAVGDGAARATTGNRNVAVGSSALLNNNIGDSNVAIGSSALSQITVSDENIGLGQSALFQLQLGARNIGIGVAAGRGLIGGNDNIYIKANAVNLENSTTRVGTGQQRTFVGGIRGVQTGVANAVPVVVDSSGQLGTISSSRRFKEDIADLGAAGDAVLKLRPVQFRYTTAYADGSKPLHYGLIAEEVAEVLPELAARGADGTIETVHYETLPTLLLAQVQRLERERVQMAERLAALERELAALRPPQK